MNETNSNFFAHFASFCESGTDSGKAKSYANAIHYLCDYLNINIYSFSSTDLQKIKSNEYYITTKTSNFYKSFMDFLKSRGQTSYLKNGFVRAALPLFYKYCSLHNL